MGAQNPNVPAYQPQHLKIQNPGMDEANTTLPSLAALSGIALNLAGTIMGRGAVGAPLVDSAGQIMDRDALMRFRKQQAEKEQAGVQALDLVSGSAADYLKAVGPKLTPAQVNLAQGLIDQGEYQRALSLMEQWFDNQRAERGQRDQLLPLLTHLQSSANKDADEAQQAIRELDRKLAKSHVGKIEELAKDIEGLTPDVVQDDIKLRALLERKYGKRFTPDVMEDTIKAIRDAYGLPNWIERLFGAQMPVDSKGQFLKGKGAAAAKRFREKEIGPEKLAEFEALQQQRGAAAEKIARAQAVRQVLQDFLKTRLPPDVANALSTPPESGTVRVVAPDGRTGSIPRANLKKALGKGYKIVE